MLVIFVYSNFYSAYSYTPKPKLINYMNDTSGRTVYDVNMITVTSGLDCGNAPKKRYIYDFCVANAQADIRAVVAMVSDDIKLNIYGHQRAAGRDQVEALLTQDANRSHVTELIIHSIITHGNQAAANGVLKFADGGMVEFGNFYTFNSFGKQAQINSVQVYSIVT